MPKLLKIEPHLTVEQIREKLSSAKKSWIHRRWMIIYTTLLEPRSCTIIAREFGLSVYTVRQLIRNYNKNGISSIETQGKGGRRNAHLSLEEEREFIGSFGSKAASGCFATVREISQALEKKVGHPIGKKTIYPMLHRNGWRKLMPRSYHPKANSEAKTIFKKNSQQLLKKLHRKKITKISKFS